MRRIAPLDYFIRWRHGRGFGIHSPFAYRFVTEVLKERYAYYAYHKIAEHFVGKKSAKCSVTFSAATCIFRTVNYFRPKHVMIVDDKDSALLRDIVRCASKSIILTDTAADADMIIISGCTDSSSDANKRLCRAISEKNITTIFTTRLDSETAALWAQLTDSLNYGMSFTNTPSTPAIYVPNPKLPRQDFRVLFG
jgi:hypothetical protein